MNIKKLFFLLGTFLLSYSCFQQNESVETQNNAKQSKLLGSPLFDWIYETPIADTLFTPEQIERRVYSLMELEYIYFPFGEISKQKFEELFYISDYHSMKKFPLKKEKLFDSLNFYDNMGGRSTAVAYWRKVSKKKASFLVITPFPIGTWETFQRNNSLWTKYYILYPSDKKSISLNLNLSKYPHRRKVRDTVTTFTKTELLNVHPYIDTVKFNMYAHLELFDSLSVQEKWNKQYAQKVLSRLYPSNIVTIERASSSVPYFYSVPLFLNIEKKEGWNLDYALNTLIYSVQDTIQNDSIQIPLEWYVYVTSFEPKGNLKTY